MLPHDGRDADIDLVNVRSLPQKRHELLLPDLELLRPFIFGFHAARKRDVDWFRPDSLLLRVLPLLLFVQSRVRLFDIWIQWRPIKVPCLVDILVFVSLWSGFPLSAGSEIGLIEWGKSFFSFVRLYTFIVQILFFALQLIWHKVLLLKLKLRVITCPRYPYSLHLGWIVLGVLLI